ncbi:uncharacterized protein [Clytia hemisphaerica]|uniref:EF-hand domain-containing protein n=1 Tax=Clytia hemisphaerica TaxID=252671 RepID=A0A7M5XEU0_9CNID|eukprot:TCONS_00030448-protein
MSQETEPNNNKVFDDAYADPKSRRRENMKHKNRAPKKPPRRGRRRLSTFFDDGVPELALKSLFMKYDKNNDGWLNKEELRGLFVDDLGLDDDQAEIYNYLLDRDGDNKISFEEFLYWMRSNENLQNVTDKHRFALIRSAVDMFQKFDKNENWSLDLEELRELIVEQGGTSERADEALRTLDEDRNGRISFQEFLKWLDWVPMDKLFFEGM